MEPFDLIYADAPWNWKARSAKGEGRSAKLHYPTMSLKDILALPVSDIAAPDSVLLLWAVDPMLPQALEVITAWGFTYKTVGFYWVKLNKRWPSAFGRLLSQASVSEASLQNLFFTGLGYHTRANPETCLLATRGRGLVRRDKGVRRLIVAPVGRHSAKPDEARTRIERLYGDVNRIELFSRSQAVNWTSWGNEAPTSVTLPGFTPTPRP